MSEFEVKAIDEPAKLDGFGVRMWLTADKPMTTGQDSISIVSSVKTVNISEEKKRSSFCGNKTPAQFFPQPHRVFFVPDHNQIKHKEKSRCNTKKCML